MKKPVAVIVGTLLAAAAVASVLLIPSREAVPTSPVATTIFPLYDIARNIADDAFDVTLILPPGAEPHSFEPTPSVTRALAEAKVVYSIGHGLDGWVNGITAAATEKVTVDAGITLRPSAEPFHDEAGGEAEEGLGPVDPHYWLSVPNAKIIAASMAADMRKRFPEHAERIDANAAAYIAKLDALDAEMRSALSRTENKNIVTFHDAWYYFAAEYGLTITGTFEPSPNREPTPRYLQELEKAVKSSGVRTLYTEPLFSSAAISAFAADNKLELAPIDDIGGTPGRESYIDMMRHNAQTIERNQ